MERHSPVPCLCYQRCRRLPEDAQKPGWKGKRWMWNAPALSHQREPPLCFEAPHADAGSSNAFHLGCGRQTGWVTHLLFPGPTCQVLPLITLICPHGVVLHPTFLHSSTSSFWVSIMIKRRKMILWPQVRIGGWYLCPISGYALGKLFKLSILSYQETLHLEMRKLSYFLPSLN